MQYLQTLARNKSRLLLFVGATVVFVLHVQVSLVLVQEKVHFAVVPRLTSSTPDLTNTTSPSPHKILILGYMRSGSTLCGDILQAHPDVFYVYEPLLYLWDYYVPHKHFEGASVRRRTKQFWRQSKPYLPEPLDFLDYMFGCNLTTYNVGFLTNVLHSRDFSAVDCLNSRKQTNLLVNLTQSCADRLHQRCHVSKTIAQKVVRLSMAEANVYLQRDPYVRIIHLIRDPRGILLSRMRFNQKNSGEMHNNYTSICLRIWEDIRVSREIAAKHWGRILTIRYEDLAQNPLSLATILYQFVGLEFLPEVKSYVHAITNSESDGKGAESVSNCIESAIVYAKRGDMARCFGNARLDRKVHAAKKTARKYPFKTAYRWRLELPFPLVRKVDQTCRKVLNAMGYVSFPTEEHLRNMNIPAKLNSYGKNVMTWRMV